MSGSQPVAYDDVHEVRRMLCHLGLRASELDSPALVMCCQIIGAICGGMVHKAARKAIRDLFAENRWPAELTSMDQSYRAFVGRMLNVVQSEMDLLCSERVDVRVVMGYVADLVVEKIESEHPQGPDRKVHCRKSHLKD